MVQDLKQATHKKASSKAGIMEALWLTKKQWSGLLKEAFTRADTFTISFDDPGLSLIERKLILAAAIAIDIDYFEQKQK